jgi:hypothetical protein
MSRWGEAGICVDSSRPSVMFYFMRVWSHEQAAVWARRPAPGVMEAAAAASWMEVFGPRCAGSRVQLEVDCTAAAAGLEKAFSPNARMMAHIKRVRTIVAKQWIILRVAHIRRQLNQVADALSKDQLQRARWLAENEFGMRLIPVSLASTGSHGSRS